MRMPQDTFLLYQATPNPGTVCYLTPGMLAASLSSLDSALQDWEMQLSP